MKARISREVLVAALGVAMSGLVTLAIVRSAASPTLAGPPRVDLAPPESESYVELQAEIRALGESFDEERRAAAIDPLVHPRVDLSGTSDFEQRLARLEEKVAELTEADESRAARGADDEAPPDQEEEVDEKVHRLQCNRVLTDSSATEAERVAAHRALRRVEDAYEPQAVQELLLLAELSMDADVRADVWTHFDGSTNLPEIVPALVQAIRTESNDAVRVEAVETLGNYLEDPQNRTLLQEIAKNDAAKAVRDRALRTLAEHPAVVD